jgi:hypothetical protein
MLDTQQQPSPQQQQQQQQEPLLSQVCSPAADLPQLMQPGQGTSSSTIASTIASSSKVSAAHDRTAAQTAVAQSVEVVAEAADNTAAEPDCIAAGPTAAAAAEQAVDATAQLHVLSATADPPAVNTVTSVAEQPMHAAAPGLSAAIGSTCGSPSQLQHQHQELQQQQEQQDCGLEMQGTAAQQYEQQQPEQHGDDSRACTSPGKQAAASAGTLGSTSSQCQQYSLTGHSMPPSSSGNGSNGSSSSIYPQAVFNRATGRAGVHQPLQLDSWRDWDAMAASMDEEGGSGFGAWTAGHED